MPPRRFYGLQHLHFVTSSTYRRTPIFDSLQFKKQFVATLGALRGELGFQLIGYVVMPEHFHLLIWPLEAFNPSEIMQRLKGRTARFILKMLHQNRKHDWCEKMLRGFKLPPTVHDESQYRVWQRRFYDMNIWTEKKKLEKLRYMHHNPVKRGLVGEPGEWAWSSWRYYYLNDASLLEMDRIP